MLTIKQHWNAVAALPCMVCGCTPVTISHSHGGSMKDRGVHKAMASKTSDWLVLPICHRHHVGADGLDRVGVLTWERLYGAQTDMLERLSHLLGYDVWQMAALEEVQHAQSRRFKRCTSRKVIKRPYG